MNADRDWRMENWRLEIMNVKSQSPVSNLQSPISSLQSPISPSSAVAHPPPFWQTPSMQRDPTTFDWRVYADATFAGLSALIPFPLVDLVFEQFFKRRMVGVIARQRGQRLSPAAKSSLNRLGCSWQSCLLFVPWLFYKLLTLLSRKILYFLAVKEAVDNLNYYWHRAFLIDYMVWAGHLDESASPQR